MTKIEVDGIALEVNEGALLIEALLEQGVAIPHFCYHPALGKAGNCRMCMVEIEGYKRPQIACDTPVKAGMVVRTKGEKIDRVKRAILELELINHPVDCPICDQAGECSLQNYYMDVGLYESRLSTPKVKGKKRVDLGANVVLDQERCVLCTRCVRFMERIAKSPELGIVGRNDHSVITTFSDKPLSSPYAMNIVDLCPVGALTSKEFRFHKRVWFLKTEEAVCNACARGCSLYVDHHREKYGDEKIYRYRPRFNAHVNGYFICDTGRLSYVREHEKTNLHALIRGKVSEYDYALTKLERLFKRHSGKMLLLLGADLSLEEMAQCVQLGKHYGASISGYSALQSDVTFGDTFLKCNERSSNAKSLALLGISCEENLFESTLNESHLVVMIGRSDTQVLDCQKEEKSVIILDAYAHASHEDVELFLPIASHMAREGSFINCEGYVQFHACAIALHELFKPFLEVSALLLKETFFTCKEVWDARLAHLIVLKNAHADPSHPLKVNV